MSTTEKEYDDEIYKKNIHELQKNAKLNSNLLLSFIKQLKIGMDMTKLQAPTYTLKPMSFLEVTSDTSYFPNFLLSLGNEKNNQKRMLLVIKYAIGNLVINSADSFAMCKPYNPILGEEFQCKFTYPDGSETHYIAEQVSHHPPISAIHSENKQHKLLFTSTLKYVGKYGGNTATNALVGQSVLHDLTHNEKYVIHFPGALCKNLFIGSGKIVVHGDLEVSCEETKLSTKLTFKNSGKFSGFVLSEGKKVFGVGGEFGKKSFVKHLEKKKTAKFYEFDKFEYGVKVVTPVKDQKGNESRRVWHKVSYNLLNDNNKLAAEEKTKVEDEQRELKKNRKDTFVPKYFKDTGKLSKGVPVYEYVGNEKK